MRRTVRFSTLFFGFAWCLAVTLPSGCRSGGQALSQADVAAHIAQRTGVALPPEIIEPIGVAEGRPISEDEATYLALCNNAAFRELLADLAVSRADLVQAGLLPNPEVVYFFNVPEKPFKYAVELPLEAFWLRPCRLKIADAENSRVAERLVQAALDLLRDTRQAYADLLLARQRLRIAEQGVVLRSRIATLAEARLQAGDATEQETATARIDMLQAKQDAQRVSYDVDFAEERLRNFLGLSDFRGSLPLLEPVSEPGEILEIEALVAEAVRTRPDALAVEHAVQGAIERWRFAKLGWIRLLGIADATSGRNTGHEFSPGLRVTVPVMNQNQGAIARAEAELARAERQRRSVHNQIVLDVRQAHTRYLQAKTELAGLAGKVRPEVEGNIRRAEAAYKEGNAAYLLVLETTRQLLDTLGREAQLQADVRRAWADLERGLGRRLALATHAPPPPAAVPTEKKRGFATDREE